MTLAEKALKYQSLAHALQSGIEYNRDQTEKDPKHLRVGINVAHSDHAALVNLLIAKGLFTQDDYFDYLIEQLEKEVQSYEEMLSAQYGANIKLG